MGNNERKIGFCILKYVVMVLRLDEPFCLWIIFDWCNKIATDCFLKVFEFDSMAYKTLLSKIKVKTPS